MLQWTWECIYLFKLLFLFSLDIYSGMGLLDHIVVPFLVFWGTSILFFIVTAPIYILTSHGDSFTCSVKEFLFLHILICICNLWGFFFGNSHSGRLWDGILLWFWFAFIPLMICSVQHIFLCHLAICMSFGKMSIQIFNL